MTVKYLFRPSRLARMLAEPGGISCAEAFAAVEANLARIAPEVAAEVDRSLDLLRASVAGASREGAAAARRRVYECANAIAGLAYYCGLEPLSAVAFSLCELTDRLIEAGRWDGDAVAVHVDAMATIRQLPGLERSACDAVVGALLELVRKTNPVRPAAAG